MTRKPGIYLSVSKDGWTKGLQMSIDLTEADGGGHGYRIHGPKFNGSSAGVLDHRITQRDIEEIRRYLDTAEVMLKAEGR